MLFRSVLQGTARLLEGRRRALPDVALAAQRILPCGRESGRGAGAAVALELALEGAERDLHGAILPVAPPSRIRRLGHNGAMSSDLAFTPGTDAAAADEVVEVLRDLLRIDTSNFGDGTGPGEAACAEYVEGMLIPTGFAVETFRTDVDLHRGVIVRVVLRCGLGLARGAVLGVVCGGLRLGS